MEYFIEIIYLIVMGVLCLKEDLEGALKNLSTYFRWHMDKENIKKAAFTGSFFLIH